jgi:uncharacterized Zn finger protein (UPF0148 family)
MEHCPNCGQPGREGAKFCTVCGYRMVADDTPMEVVAETPNVDVSSGNSNGDEDAAQPMTGWAATLSTSESAAEAAWAKPDAGDGVAARPRPGEAAVEELPTVWATTSSSTWPSPPENSAPAPSDSGNEPEQPTADLEESAPAAASEPSEESTPAAIARARANALLVELQAAIAAIEGGPAVDLTGVISDLEVAVTPPGAINPDQLNTLREALLAARERPRDIDTMVDLTGRVDALVALVFAYDRAIAAIERALDVLRQAYAKPD